MTTDQLTRNKHLVESFIQELFTKGDLTAVDRYVAPTTSSTTTRRSPARPRAPRACARPRKIMRAAVPDWRSEADHYVAEGDLVVEHFHALRHPHRRAVRRARRRQDRSRLRGIHIFRIANDKIVERWGCLDFMAFNQQLAGC